MDSTAGLVGSDAPHVDLSGKFLLVGQHDMKEDNPIALHLKLQPSFVTASLCLRRLRNSRVVPACDMSVSIAPFAPVGGLALASDNLRIIVADRSGLG
jgi:hypothetical protein